MLKVQRALLSTDYRKVKVHVQNFRIPLHSNYDTTTIQPSIIAVQP